MSELAAGWLPRGELQALGWTLLHFCWQGAAIALLYAVVDRLTLRASAATRYAVALGALALMPLLVALTFADEMQAIPRAQTSVAVEANGAVIQYGIAQQIPRGMAPIAEVRGSWTMTRAERLLPWVDATWMLGVLLLATRALGGWWQLERVRRRARGMVPASVESSFQQICELLHVGRRVALRVSDEVVSPMAMGIWRATVILPVGALMQLSSEELEAVLAHELGHIRRWDYLFNLMQTAVESALFFHPAVWWVSRAVRDRREVCCDEIAVSSCTDAVVYARALLLMEEQRATNFRLAVALEGRRGTLLGRVKQILGEGGNMESNMTSGVRVAVAGAIVMGLLLGPKLNDAVAAPLVAASRPVVAKIASALPSPVSRMIISQTPVVSAQATVQVTSNVAPEVSVAVEPAPAPTVEEAEAEPQADQKTNSPKGMAYLDGMRAAGYPLDLNNDLDALVSLKSLGVTPEYAKAMANIGLGKPDVHELISLKSLGVTPEYVAGLKQSGIEPKDFHEVVSEKSLGVTPEYARAMADIGLGKPDVRELVSLKALGITPEYVAGLKQSGIGPKDFHEVISEKSLGVTPEYATEMKKIGFGDMDVQALISLKAQGMTPEYASWLKKEFPQATIDQLRRAAVFHLDDKFVSQAKAHGFSGTDMDKLLRLKMSGLLDE